MAIFVAWILVEYLATSFDGCFPLENAPTMQEKDTTVIVLASITKFYERDSV